MTTIQNSMLMYKIIFFLIRAICIIVKLIHIRRYLESKSNKLKLDQQYI